MPIFSSLRASELLRRRYESAKKSAESFNWWNIAVGIFSVVAVLFLILGLIWLSQGDENIARTWVFFSFGLCGTLLGISYFIWRFTSRIQISTSSTRRRRHHPPHGRSARVWSTPQRQSTHHHQQPTPRHAERPVDVSRNANAAPPTYEEAIMGANSISVPIENTPPAYARPTR